MQKSTRPFLSAPWQVSGVCLGCKALSHAHNFLRQRLWLHLMGQETQRQRAEATCPQVTASEAQSWDSNPALTPMPLFHPSPCLSWDPGYIQMGIWLIYSPVINEANQSGKFRKLFSKKVILLSLILKFIFLIGQWYFQLFFQEEIECKWLW